MWQPVQDLVFKILCMKFPSKADAELKQKLAAKEVSREYVVRQQRGAPAGRRGSAGRGGGRGLGGGARVRAQRLEDQEKF